MPIPTFQAYNAQDVTPNDSVDIQWQGATLGTNNSGPSLYVGGAGDVKVTMVGGQTVTFVGVPAGTFMPIQVKRVWSTGTSATSIVAIM